jgi:hypothetical protein
MQHPGFTAVQSTLDKIGERDAARAIHRDKTERRATRRELMLVIKYETPKTKRPTKRARRRQLGFDE